MHNLYRPLILFTKLVVCLCLFWLPYTVWDHAIKAVPTFVQHIPGAIEEAAKIVWIKVSRERLSEEDFEDIDIGDMMELQLKKDKYLGERYYYVKTDGPITNRNYDVAVATFHTLLMKYGEDLRGVPVGERIINVESSTRSGWIIEKALMVLVTVFCLALYIPLTCGAAFLIRMRS